MYLKIVSPVSLKKGITMVDKEGTEKPSGQCRIESPATNHQIAGNSLKQFQPSKNGNVFVAQVMTRGKVKSKLMYSFFRRRSKGKICSQVLKNFFFLNAVHRLNVGWLYKNKA
jgi:hypothetical protein